VIDPEEENEMYLTGIAKLEYGSIIQKPQQEIKVENCNHDLL